MKWFAELSFGYPTMTGTMLIEAGTVEEAEAEARKECIEWASSYGFEQDPDHFGDYDSVGREWDEDEESYNEEGTLEPSVEPYNSEEHDGYL